MKYSIRDGVSDAALGGGVLGLCYLAGWEHNPNAVIASSILLIFLGIRLR